MEWPTFLGLNEKEEVEMTKETAKQETSVRCAIYTRQSVADDKEFGSIKAQREAVELYVKSQPGWQALPECYSDPGYSGGTIARPAFKRLLQDIETGGIDAVAVYKLDRLSRSINDFVKITDLFAQHGVRFVSTTQAFDTSTSVGRMTVNLLATFATFERDLIRERTAHAMGAARRRGLWLGGQPVLGYNVRKKTLVINTEEAQQVREIFRLYLERGSLLAVVKEISRRGWKTKQRKKNGSVIPGRAYDKNAVRRILGNPLYIGKVEYDGELYAGAHEAIIDDKTWQAVQRQLKVNGKSRRRRSIGKSGALLKGLIRCAVCGAAMTVNTSRKGNRRFAYYVCRSIQTNGAAACSG